jgi:hypothetical protein
MIVKVTHLPSRRFGTGHGRDEGTAKEIAVRELHRLLRSETPLTFSRLRAAVLS